VLAPYGDHVPINRNGNAGFMFTSKNELNLNFANHSTRDDDISIVLRKNE
jgi:hypothetical protein